MLQGKLSDPDTFVEYSIGKGKFHKASGGLNWKIKAKLAPGKNSIVIRTVNSRTGQISKDKKLSITRS